MNYINSLRSFFVYLDKSKVVIEKNCKPIQLNVVKLYIWLGAMRYERKKD